MLFENLLNRGVSPVLERVISFTQERHQVLTDNISNFDTVGYKMKDLSGEEFAQEMDRALKTRSQGGAGAPLALRTTRHLAWDARGHLQANRIDVENNNILFQDDNNRFVEKQMSQMARNALMHNLSSDLLRQQFGLLGMAISGKV